MSPGMRPVRIQPADVAEEDAIKSWLDALASGSCDAPTFLEAMQDRFGAEAEENWEILSQLDQYYRRGRIDTEAFNSIKTALAESAMGLSSSSPAMDNSAVRAAPPASTPAAKDNSAVRAAPRALASSPPATQHSTARAVAPPARASTLSATNKSTVRATPPAARDTSATRDIAAARDETQSSDSIDDLKPGAVLRRRYRIEGVLGHGRTGTVFQILDEFRLEGTGTQRLALKVLHPAVAKRADLLADLRREFQSLQLLSHPNIIRVFDFDRDGPLVFFTMELLTGATLSRLLQARKLVPLERPQALAAIRDIGAALAYAHAHGTVHGDLNLQNIFITGSGEVRVMGFGGSFKARDAYQAPDQEMTLPFSASTCASCQVLEGERADIRDDVFSLAYIAYLLLSGAHPFTKSTAIEARAAKFRIRRPARLSGRQWRALRSALRWECEKRPTDVERWLKELEIRGAAPRLAPLGDLLQIPSAKKSSWVAASIATAVAVLLFAGYWALGHRDMLPTFDSTPSPRAPAAAAPSAAKLPPPAATSVPASNEAPVALAPKTPPAAAASLRPTPPIAALELAPAAASATGAPKVELTADMVDVLDGQPSAEVTVHRKGNLRGETSFTWWTESGTAKPGADFSAVVPQLAYFENGKSTVFLSIPLRNIRHAQSKSFYVVIEQSPGGAPLGSRTLTLVTLMPGG
jgi:serine/threonine protein kinase